MVLLANFHVKKNRQMNLFFFSVSEYQFKHGETTAALIQLLPRIVATLRNCSAPTSGNV